MRLSTTMLPKLWGLQEGRRCFLMLLLPALSRASTTRMRSDLPTYLYDNLLGLSVEPHPVLYNSAHTVNVTINAPPPPPPPTSSSKHSVVIVSGSPEDFRLPETIRPLHYSIRVQPFIHGNKTMPGVVDMELEVTRPTPNITFHVNQMVIMEEDIKLVAGEGDLGGAVPRITHFTADFNNNMFSTHLEKEVEAGRKLKLTVPYIASLETNGAGFFVVYYTDEGVERMMLASLLEPWDARRAFPCLDEPHLKATFDLHVARTTNMTALANMPLAHTTPLGGEPGWVVDSFQRTPLMSTYNLMLVVSPLHHINLTTNTGLPVRIWSRADKIQKTSFLQQVVLKLIHFLEDYMAIPFSLPKLDLVAVPAEYTVAFEGWGLIQYYNDKKIGVDPTDDNSHRRNSLALLTAHELAHQWFGNLVTPHWWSELWLSEGIVSYFDHIAGNYVLPGEEWVRDRPQRMLQMMLKVDSRPHTHPLHLPVFKFVSVFTLFDSIEYHKGSAIMRMVNYVLTPDTLRNGIRDYLKAHQYGSVTQEDLWHHLTEAGHREGTLPCHLALSTIMDSWTRKEGYPVIKVVKIPGRASATVYQERFVVQWNNKTLDRHAHKWWIPLTFTSQEAGDFSKTRVWLWMRDTESQMKVRPLPKNQWIIFNVQQTGYYRVNYDRGNWRLLTQQLLTNHTVIHVANRAQLIDDALQLALADKLDYKIALNVTSYLSREEDSLPWKSCTSNMKHMKQLLHRTPAGASLKKYLLSLLVPILSVLKLDSSNETSEIQMKHSDAVKLACSLDHPDCVHLATSLYTQWVDNPKSIQSVPLELRETVYCTAIAHGGEAEWNFARRQYTLATDQQYKHLLLKVMGCSRVIGQETTGGQLRDQPQGLKEAGQQHLAWTFLTRHWGRVTSLLGEDEDAMERLVMAATESFNTHQDVNELEKFRDAHRDHMGVVRASESALRRTALNLDWLEQNYGVVSEWLQEQGYSPGGR